MECALLFSLLWSVSTFDDVNGGVVVKEDSDAVLPCSLSTKENIETKIFDWKKDDHKEVFHYNGGDYYGHGITGQDKQFEGRVSHFEYELVNGNASIKITETKVSDSGNYTCFFPRLQPPQTFLIELLVECILKDRTKEEEPSACSKPSVTSLKSTKDWSLLQCEVYGASPRPEVEWRNSSGNILNAKETQVTEREGSYDIILQTTVTKNDHYSCVLTQNEICHQISSKISVYIHDPEESTQGFSAGSIISPSGFAVPTALFFVGVIVLAALFVRGRKDFLMKRFRHDDKKNNEDVTSDHLEETDHMKDIPERNLTDEGFD
ncbi:CD276 antigen-like isoform X5 [Labrus bergylta]|uniref:CD276 antigen-like isoform X5 n=1 Tax=Labrus bergylta TaxID=56723 RepID=UPI0033140BB2